MAFLDNNLQVEYESRLHKPETRNNRKTIYSDRFVPNRTDDFHTDFSLYSNGKESSALQSTYTMIIKNEILRKDAKSSPNFLQYNTRKEISTGDSPYSLSPLGNESQKLLSSPKKPPRKISRIPFKILEAPHIQDDFYLNLVDWSSQNVLAVGLGSSVYLWNAVTSQVKKLCEVTSDLFNNTVTSVCWTRGGSQLAVGTTRGIVSLWDITKGKLIKEITGHKSRVGAIAWNNSVLYSGSRDRAILQRDTRVGYLPSQTKLAGHKQEVCGLKWSTENQMLASGGNDNKLLIWDSRSTIPLARFTEHCAAVKAISWSPHQRGLLASGGGTADRCIRFWNTSSGSSQSLQHIDTGSQVCNLAWSKNVNEIVSTHGYSQNQIVVWSYPSMSQIVNLTGHTTRVLYLSVSPDGQTIVTGAGDETLRFWNIFPSAKENARSSSSLLLNAPAIR